MQTLDGIRARPIPISHDVRQYLNMLCDFLAHLRTPVRRDRYTRELIQMPEVESTSRISRQFTQLIQGITLARGEPEPGTLEVSAIDQVAVSSVPSLRLKLITSMPLDGAGLRDIAETSGIPYNTCHRLVEDLVLLGLVSREGRKIQGSPGYFWPADAYRMFFRVAQRITRGNGWGEQ